MNLGPQMEELQMQLCNGTSWITGHMDGGEVMDFIGDTRFSSYQYSQVANAPSQGESSAAVELWQPENATAVQVLEDQKAQRPRIGHKKSRGGCFSCKRRKIKCQEVFPACYNCLRIDLECKYPTVTAFEARDVIASRIKLPQLSVPLQSTPRLFTLDDMRFFQHFIFNAYPHLPLNNDNVWTRSVPAFAHQYEYLMHAMLGLAATHLTMLSDSNYNEIAIKHRLLAISGFNKALSKKPEKEADGDALLATIYALTFQSSYMKDSLAEFLTMARGCILLTGQLQISKQVIMFGIDEDAHTAYMDPMLEKLPPIDHRFVDGAADSLEALSFVLNDPVNGFFYKELIGIVIGARVSPKLGYYKLASIYSSIGQLENVKFTDFLSSSNSIGPILLAHFIALELILLPIIALQWDRTGSQFKSRLDWVNKIKNKTPPRMQAFMKWPAKVMNQASGQLNGKF